MARTVKDTHLGKRSARQSIPRDGQTRWGTIHEGLHVGYRKSKRGGRWVARVYVPNKANGSKYVKQAIGVADDVTDADGVQVFSWEQAQDRAREIATTVAAEATGQHVGPYTVADAMEDYHRALEHNGRVTGPSRRRTELHILPVLGSIRLEDLTVETLRDWLKGVADHPGFNRRGEVRRRPKLDSPEDEVKYQRRRRDSANRILTILKAGLNHAFEEGKTSSNAAFGKRLKPFPTTSRSRDKYLSMDEVRRLVNAAEPGFRELVQGALYTGARYGDLAAMDVGDFNADRGLVMSSNGKAGRPHPVYLTSEGVAFFKRQTAGRRSGEPMFVHPDGDRRWRKSDQLRPMKKAAQAANVDVSFHGLRHTYASHMVMKKVPLLVVAQNLGHSDTRMVEEHYAHLADSHIRDSVRGSGLEWDITTADNVVAL